MRRPNARSTSTLAEESAAAEGSAPYFSHADPDGGRHRSPFRGARANAGGARAPGRGTRGSSELARANAASARSHGRDRSRSARRLPEAWLLRTILAQAAWPSGRPPGRAARGPSSGSAAVTASRDASRAHHPLPARPAHVARAISARHRARARARRLAHDSLCRHRSLAQYEARAVVANRVWRLRRIVRRAPLTGKRLPPLRGFGDRQRHHFLRHSPPCFSRRRDAVRKRPRPFTPGRNGSRPAIQADDVLAGMRSHSQANDALMRHQHETGASRSPERVSVALHGNDWHRRRPRGPRSRDARADTSGQHGNLGARKKS